MQLHQARRRGIPAPTWRWDAFEGLPPGATFSSTSAARTYIGADGYLKTAAAGAARFSYGGGPTAAVIGTPGAPDGYMQENAVTNAALQCRDLTQAVWVKTNATAVKDQTGIDGTANSASRFTANANGATVAQAVTIAAALTASLYVRRITGTGNLTLTLSGASGGSQVLSIPSDGKWHRYSLNWSAATANPTITLTAATSGDAFAIDYVQVQAEEVATSPIATAAAAVSTTAEVLTVPLAGFIPYGGMTMLLRCTPFYAASIAAAARNWLSLSDGTTANRVSIFQAAGAVTPTGRVTVASSGALSGATTGPNLVAHQESTIIIATGGGGNGLGTGSGPYIQNDRGVPKVTQGVPGVPVGLTTLNIAATDAGGQGSAFGAIREVAIYPQALGADQAQRLAYRT